MEVLFLKFYKLIKLIFWLLLVLIKITSRFSFALSIDGFLQTRLALCNRVWDSILRSGFLLSWTFFIAGLFGALFWIYMYLPYNISVSFLNEYTCAVFGRINCRHGNPNKPLACWVPALIFLYRMAIKYIISWKFFGFFITNQINIIISTYMF